MAISSEELFNLLKFLIPIKEKYMMTISSLEEDELLIDKNSLKVELSKSTFETHWYTILMDMYTDVKKRGHLFCLIFNTWASRTRRKQARIMELKHTQTAGIGVFSIRRIEKNTKLCDYTGDEVDVTAGNDIKSNYVMEAGDRYVGRGIDARNPKTGYCGFFNDNKTQYKINARAREKATAFTIQNSIEIVTTKPIPPNKEICLSYGGLCFWKDKYLKRDLNQIEDPFVYEMLKHHCQKEKEILIEIDLEE